MGSLDMGDTFNFEELLICLREEDTLEIVEAGALGSSNILLQLNLWKSYTSTYASPDKLE